MDWASSTNCSARKGACRGDHAGWPFLQGCARNPGNGASASRSGPPRAVVGSSQLRGIGHALRPQRRIAHAGSGAARANFGAGPRADGPRRRFGGRAGIAAGRGGSARSHLAPQPVVDQRRHRQLDDAGRKLLLRARRRCCRQGHGSGCRDAGFRRPDPAQSAQPRGHRQPGSRRVHRHHGALGSRLRSEPDFAGSRHGPSRTSRG